MFVKWHQPPQTQIKLQPITTPAQAWYHLRVDLVCDLQENSEGYKHLLVTTRYLSKFCEVWPLRTKNSRAVLTQLEDIYITLGVPKIIQHDQCPEFVSKVHIITTNNCIINNIIYCLFLKFRNFRNIMNGWELIIGMLQLKIHIAMVLWKPKTRSWKSKWYIVFSIKFESFQFNWNKILQCMFKCSKLNKMVLEAGVEWPSGLQAAVLAANTCWKRSTKFTPFFFMYGRGANSAYMLEHLRFIDNGNDDLQICSDSGNQNNDWIAPVNGQPCRIDYTSSR